jgi:8-oxo-dGTP pyrophosphatase MutT (NUDIX family)
MSRSQKSVRCGVILIRPNSQFLIVKNTLSRLWGFPKGHQSPGETYQETALRELAEEAGITLDKVDLHMMFKKKNWFMFTAYVDSNTVVNIDNNEICAYKWTNYDNFTKLNMSQGTKLFLHDLSTVLDRQKRVCVPTFKKIVLDTLKINGVNEVNDNSPIST